MTVIFHPEFPNDIRKFESGYAEISSGLALRFRAEVDARWLRSSHHRKAPAIF